MNRRGFIGGLGAVGSLLLSPLTHLRANGATPSKVERVFAQLDKTLCDGLAAKTNGNINTLQGFSRRPPQGRVAQRYEAMRLGRIQCGFESHPD